MAEDRVLSSYVRDLAPEIRERYLGKIALINNEDPYDLLAEELDEDFRLIPQITYLDIVNYLVYTKSYYTADDFKAYKSLEAHKQFSCGWVRDVQAKKYGDKCLIKAKVLHSQSFNATPLQPWVIADNNGVIVSAHCTCMAGLGEACTHVGALLFYIEYGVRHYEAKTVTDELAYWPVPSAKEVPYSRIRDIDFTTPLKKCKRLEGNSTTPSPTCNPPKPPLTTEEIRLINQQIFNSGVRSAFLSVTREFQSSFLPEKTSSFTELGNLFNPDFQTLSHDQLIIKCSSITITITQQEATKIEEATRGQSDCTLWFKMRAGRVTASKFKAACHTKSPTSSPSLIKAICYPELVKFKNKATEWGCEHEKIARSKYEEFLKDRHEDLVVSNVGLVVNPKYPFLGASPDGIVTCSCCGTGVIEIKCPFCLKDLSVDALPSNNCLQFKDSGKQSLKRNHAYYYQVQAQLWITQHKYADFVVWSNVGDPYIERIFPDELFWKAALVKATKFFREGVMLELVAKFFSRGCTSVVLSALADSTNDATSLTGLNHSFDSGSDIDSSKQWCICNGKENDDDDDDDNSMIMCESNNCSVQWYHIRCMKLKYVPKGKYICPQCKPASKRQGKCRPK